MRTRTLLGFVAGTLSVSTANLLAQSADDAAGAAACAGCGGLLFVIAGIFALQIALLVWVARDAKARGMDSAVIWMLFVFFVQLLGLIVYSFSRPQGTTVMCAECGNKRLQVSAKCPHCGKP